MRFQQISRLIKCLATNSKLHANSIRNVYYIVHCCAAAYKCLNMCKKTNTPDASCHYEKL